MMAGLCDMFIEGSSLLMWRRLTQTTCFSVTAYTRHSRHFPRHDVFKQLLPQLPLWALTVLTGSGPPQRITHMAVLSLRVTGALTRASPM